jgi:hypothetical protein
VVFNLAFITRGELFASGEKSPWTILSISTTEAARLAYEHFLSELNSLGYANDLPENWNTLIENPRATARGPWPYTDDTTMALAILEVLGEFGRIDQDALAQRFAARYRAAP